MSGLSSVLKLTDLNDYINPAQECTKPIQSEKNIKGASKVKIGATDDYSFHSSQNITAPKEVKITLQDCLACSGCITSAESVLISQQSHEEFLNVLTANSNKSLNDKSVIIVSISPQTIASFAARYNFEYEQSAKKLASFFKSLGANFVFDTNFARDFSLYELSNEFIKRFKAKDHSSNKLPLLTSICPGWICYAEKQHGSYIIPYISSVKSPQQIMGSLIKDYLSLKLEKKPNQIYHLTVMPCFDKKLEASRDDFYNEFNQTKDVDCVITTLEVEALLKEKNVSLNDVLIEDLDSLIKDDYSLCNLPGSGSGGYCEYVFKYAAQELFNIKSPSLNYKTIRSKDFIELNLEKDGQILLRFAIANGFSNIQRVVRKIKLKQCNYDFVEIMACPSGCLNGGAQLRDLDDKISQELLKKSNELYHSVPYSFPEENNIFGNFYKEWLGESNSQKAKSLLHTHYHVREKPTSGLSFSW